MKYLTILVLTISLNVFASNDYAQNCSEASVTVQESTDSQSVCYSDLISLQSKINDSVTTEDEDVSDLARINLQELSEQIDANLETMESNNEVCEKFLNYIQKSYQDRLAF